MVFDKLLIFHSIWTFAIKNHGIPANVANNVLEQMKEFFALPLESKMKVMDDFVDTSWKSLFNGSQLNKNNTPNLMGYSARSGADNARRIRREDSHISWEELVDDKGARGEDVDGPMSGANIWPPNSEAPNFREAILKF